MRRPRDARAYIRPLAEHQVPHLPRHPTACRAPSAAPATQKPRQSGGDQGTPGRTSDRLQSTKCRTCHAIRPLAEETKGRQGVHPTACRAPSAAPATPSDRLQSRPRDARAYIRPLAEHQVPRNAAPATQKPPAERRRARGARAYIRPLAEHQVVRHAKATGSHLPRHPTGCRAPSAAPATQKPPAE